MRFPLEIDSHIAAMGMLNASTMAAIVEAAQGCGAGALGAARRLASAVSDVEADRAVRDLRSAFAFRGAAAEEGLVLLGTWLDRRHMCEEIVDGDPEASSPGAAVDVMRASEHDAPMKKGKPQVPANREGPEWEAFIKSLLALGNDKALVDLAIEHAGSQTQLSQLCGLAVESISRGRNGRLVNGFSETTRGWFAAYLCNRKNPPPPMAHVPGPKARKGAAAPPIWISPEAMKRFEEESSRLMAFGGQRQALDWLMRRWLRKHAVGELPKLKTKGDKQVALRTRIAPALLEAFDTRVGGPELRADYLVLAVESGLPALAKLMKLPKVAKTPAAEQDPAAA